MNTYSVSTLPWVTYTKLTNQITANTFQESWLWVNQHLIRNNWLLKA